MQPQNLSDALRVVGAACRIELLQLKRSPLLVSLTIIQAVTFLFLVSLFGMTGAMAPTAVIDRDMGGRAQAFIQNLNQAHHSFSVIRSMTDEQAMDALKHGNLVAKITIPKNFTRSILRRQNSSIDVVVDNIDTDMTEDIQRALPSAITAFAKEQNLGYINVEVEETDLIDHDTDFVTYLIASSLVLAAFIIACNLSATSVAREYESKTAVQLCLSPSHPLLAILGRLLGDCLFSLAAMTLPVAVAVINFGIRPVNWLEMIACLLLCVFTFSCFGAALGAFLKRTLPVASVVFGLALPLFMVSGAYEPERFDGNLIWGIAHCSPIYFGVGIIEHAVHGLHVTPESVGMNFLILGVWCLGFLGMVFLSARRGITQ